MIDEARLTAFAADKFGTAWRMRGAPTRPPVARRPVFIIESDQQPLFVKVTTGPEARAKAEAEARGLTRLAQVDGIRTPAIVGISLEADSCYLVLEHISCIAGEALTDGHWAIAGERIACLHRESWASFGLDHPNYIGDFPQTNTPEASWNRFYIHNRIMPMYGRAIEEGVLTVDDRQRLDRLIERIDEISNRDIRPVLLHGDLWPGNIIFDEAGPILIDPAISFGNSQMDMSFAKFDPRLTFPAPFYDAYDHAAPAEADGAAQTALWQLWPILTHIVQDGDIWLPHLRSALDAMEAQL
jgi:protein-ribulosamine 3-kinase